MKKTKYLSLPEENEWYTIQDTVKLLCESINPDYKEILTKENKKNLYQKIKRGLEKQNCQPERQSDRKTTYKRNEILRVVNGTDIYIDFYIVMSKMTDKEIIEFKENSDKYKEIAKECSRIDAELKRKGLYDNMMQEIPRNQTESIFNEEEELNKLKFRCFTQIMLDLFEFDEATAKHDIPSLYTYEPQNPLESDIESLERLKDVSNYYNKDLVAIAKKRIEHHKRIKEDAEKKEKRRG